ncbi:hypothetical protein RUND412_010358 [Rhizina undulata]
MASPPFLNQADFDEEFNSDNVSLNSSVSSEDNPDETYLVEEILAEKFFGAEGVHKYLVKWSGYPIERASWEPIEMFDDKNTINEWKVARERKDASGNASPPFDAQKWDRDRSEEERQRRRRHERRQQKRSKLTRNRAAEKFVHYGRSRSASDAAPYRKDGGFVVEDNKVSEDEPDSDVPMMQKSRRVKREQHKKKLEKKSEGEALEDDGNTSYDSLLEEVREKSTKVKKGVKAKSSQKRRFGGRKMSTIESSEEESSLENRSNKTKYKSSRKRRRVPSPRSDPSTAVQPLRPGSAAERRASGSSGRLPPDPVSRPGPTKKRRTIGSIAGNAQAHAKFLSLSQQNKVYMKGRNEPPPDINALELFHPSDHKKPPTAGSDAIRRTLGSAPTKEPSKAISTTNISVQSNTLGNVFKSVPAITSTNYKIPKRILNTPRASNDAAAPQRNVPGNPDGSLTSNGIILQQPPSKRVVFAKQDQVCSATLEEELFIGGSDPTLNPGGDIDFGNEDTPMLDHENDGDKLVQIQGVDESTNVAHKRSFECVLELGPPKAQMETLGSVRFTGFSAQFVAMVKEFGVTRLWISKFLEDSYIGTYFVPELGPPLEFADLEVEGDECQGLLGTLTVMHGAGVVIHENFTLLIFLPSNERLRHAFKPPMQQIKTPLRAVKYPPLDVEIPSPEAPPIPLRKPLDNEFQYYIHNLLFRCLGVRCDEILPSTSDGSRGRWNFVIYCPEIAIAEKMEMEAALRLLGKEAWSVKDIPKIVQKFQPGLRPKVAILVHVSLRRQLHLLPHIKLLKSKEHSFSFIFFGLRLDRTGDRCLLNSAICRFWSFGTLILVTAELAIKHPEALIHVVNYQKRKAGSTKFCIPAGMLEYVEEHVIKNMQNSEGEQVLKGIYALVDKQKRGELLELQTSETREPWDKFEQLTDAYLCYQLDNCAEFRRFMICHTKEEDNGTSSSGIYEILEFLDEEAIMKELLAPKL